MVLQCDVTGQCGVTVKEMVSVVLQCDVAGQCGVSVPVLCNLPVWCYGDVTRLCSVTV